MKTSFHRQIDHTADVALEIWAPTLHGLFHEGAVAIVDVLTAGRTVKANGRHHARLEFTDTVEGLVVWLNEVIYWAVTKGFLFNEGEIRVEEGWMEASMTIESDAFDALETELKSVTYHDLVLEERDDGWFARIVIDV